MANMGQQCKMLPEDQVEFLATQWMGVKEFEEAGIPCRKGPFTREESRRAQAALQMYQKENNLDDEKFDDLMRSSQPTNGFWSYVARAVPQRGVKSVFYHVRRARDPLAKAGKWCAAEDEQLWKAVQTHGNDWVAIADVVQRSPADCSDRFRQYTQYQDTKRMGAWSSEEESHFLHVIEELARQGKSDMSARGFWVSVSKAMGAIRTPKQCQNKWSDSLQGKVKNQNKSRQWKLDDSYILIFKIASLDVDDESDIDWKSLNDPMWNMWSGHRLQQKWKALKIALNAGGLVSHRDAVNRLVTWVSATRQLPAPPTTTMSSAPSSPSP